MQNTDYTSLPCPSCGELKMSRIKSDCTLQDGTTIPQLERWQCSTCKADFFDTGAIEVIGRFLRKK